MSRGEFQLRMGLTRAVSPFPEDCIQFFVGCLLRLLLPARPRRHARTALMHSLAQAELR